MERHTSFATDGTVVPIVCRQCGGIERVSIGKMHAQNAIPCTTCGRSINLAGIATALPKTLNVDAPSGAPRPVSEFP